MVMGTPRARAAVAADDRQNLGWSGPLHCRQVEAVNVIRRSQQGQAADSTRFACDQKSKESAGIGSQQ
jgi:hypothetical protein